jgi:hypothetical protein
MDETAIASLDKFVASPYRQEIELQHVAHRADYVTLRVRIREMKRFTIFDIDPLTARRWGQAMLDWARQHDSQAGAGQHNDVADSGEHK